MASENETVADIVAEMRKEGHSGEASCLEWVGAKLRSYADRIEAAANREREAGVEAAQVCGEIGEMIGREAAREKSSQVGNAAKMREALDKIYNKLETLDVEEDSYADEIIASVKSDIVDALSAPPRNCDRPECATTKAAQDVWSKEDGGKTAYYEWLLATYTEGGTTDGKKH